MLNKLLFFVVIIEVALLVVNIDNNKKNYKYSIDILKNNNVDNAKLDNYVIGVVAAEMPATFSSESLKAQAVAARTFAYRKIINNSLDYDSLANDKGQAYISKEEMKNKWDSSYNEYYSKIKDAVLSTSGIIITKNNMPINAYYFSLSNGTTENSSAVFNDESYLVSVDSSWDKEQNNYEKTITISKDEFCNKLNIKGDIIINNIEKSNTNHVSNITINNVNFSGIDIRKKLNLRSTDFDIYIDDEIKIVTRGYGHGVGMSQYGANYLANNGKSYKEILNYYYKDIELSKI